MQVIHFFLTNCVHFCGDEIILLKLTQNDKTFLCFETINHSKLLTELNIISTFLKYGKLFQDLSELRNKLFYEFLDDGTC